MTVYIVTSDNNGRMSVFATKELAKQFIKNLGVKNLFIMPWQVRTEAEICRGEERFWDRVDKDKK